MPNSEDYRRGMAKLSDVDLRKLYFQLITAPTRNALIEGRKSLEEHIQNDEFVPDGLDPDMLRKRQ